MPLNPEAKQFLDTLSELGLPPFETIPLEMMREVFDADNPDAPTGPAIHEVVDQVVAGPAGPIDIRIHRASGDADVPAVMYFHGGGWVLGHLNSHEPLCRALAEETGATVIAVHYRRAPEHPYPAAFEDCVAVTRWVVDNAEEFGVDASRIAVAGDSAGGNLAAAVALWARDASVELSAQVLIYPASNLAETETQSYRDNGEGYLLTAAWMTWFIEQYVPEAAARLEWSASPAKAGDLSGLPPAFVVTAEFDPLRDDGKTYADLLTAAGVDARYRNFDGAIHGFATQVDVFEDSATLVAEIGSFLRQNGV